MPSKVFYNRLPGGENLLGDFSCGEPLDDVFLVEEIAVEIELPWFKLNYLGNLRWRRFSSY